MADDSPWLRCSTGIGHVGITFLFRGWLLEKIDKIKSLTEHLKLARKRDHLLEATRLRR